jgi:hypothetical protein
LWQKQETGLITLQQKNSIFQLVMLVAVILLLGWYILICCNYPYYFIWDIDLTTALDSVLIHSGLLPDHLHHTGFGMYLLLFFSEKIAHFFNIVSVLNLKDVTNSLNPLAAMAELTDFIRFHSPFLSIGIVVLLCSAIQVMSGMSRWYFIFFLFILGTQESLAYQSSMVRTEVYSIFYWSAAFLTLTTAVKAGSFVGRCGWFLLTGLLLGLSLLTKIQSLFYVCSFAVLSPLMFSIFSDSREPYCRDLTRKGAYLILALSFFNIIASVILGIAAQSTVVPEGILTWATSFRITPISAVLFLAMIAMFLCQLYCCLKNRMSSSAFRYSSFFSIVVTGFILSFALHFVFYSDAALSLQYLLLDFKMTFLRNIIQIQSLSDSISDFLLYLHYNPVLFIVNILLNLLLVLGYYFKIVRITRGQMIMCLLVTAIALVNIFAGTRYMLRDILWKEMLLNFLSLFFFAILVTRAIRYRRTLTTIGTTLLIVLFYVNCVHSCRITNRIDANFNHYGWRQDKWFSEVYGQNQPKYRQIMQGKYNGTTMRVAEAKATEHMQIKRTVNFVFKNQDVTFRNIGIVFEGFSAWSTDLDYKIAEVPPAMRGAILVDNASIEPQRNTFFKEKYVREHSEYLDKFKNPSPAKQISILTRRDLRIFIFVSANDIPSLVNDQIVPTDYKIILRNSKQSIELQGLEIRNYSEISLNKITQKFFFVICEI